jgi:hypothetical protein
MQSCFPGAVVGGNFVDVIGRRGERPRLIGCVANHEGDTFFGFRPRRRGESQQTSAKQASNSLDLIFMMIFVLEEPISSAMLRFGVERDLNETRRTEGNSKKTKKLAEELGVID